MLFRSAHAIRDTPTEAEVRAHSVQVGQFVHQSVGGNRPFKPTQESYTITLTLPTVLSADFKGVP